MDSAHVCGLGEGRQGKLRRESLEWTHVLKEKLIEDYSEQKKDLSKLLRVNNGVCKNAPIIILLKIYTIIIINQCLLF